jgi:hypothetical protein
VLFKRSEVYDLSIFYREAGERGALKFLDYRTDVQLHPRW